MKKAEMVKELVPTAKLLMVLGGVNADNLMGRLTTRETFVIRYRFGFYDGKAHTLQETAEKMDLSTRERIRQIEGRAIRRLRAIFLAYIRRLEHEL